MRHLGGGLTERSWVDWLLGLIPLGYPGGGSAGRSWVGWLLSLVPLGLLGWAGCLGELNLGPWYPQESPIQYRGKLIVSLKKINLRD